MTDEQALKLAQMIGEMRAELKASIHILQEHVLELGQEVKSIREHHQQRATAVVIPRDRMPSFSGEAKQNLESIRVEAETQTTQLGTIAKQITQPPKGSWLQAVAIAAAVFISTLIGLLAHK